MTIIDWFEPNNIEHIRAYAVLNATGWWPHGFVPKDIAFPPLWATRLASILADCWIKHILTGRKEE